MWKANEFSPTGKLEAFLQFANPRHAKQDDLLNSCALSETCWETGWLQSLGVCACDHPLGANSASESQQSCLDLPVVEVKYTFWGPAVWASHFVLWF